MFNPATRHPSEKINKQAADIIQSPFFSELLEDVPIILLIVNDARQVIYLNKNLQQDGHEVSGDRLLGLRPGECLDCVHIVNGQFGCGSTNYCKVCGLSNSIAKSEQGKKNQGECVISLKNGEDLILNVQTRPFRHQDENFIFCAIENISDRKARYMLENIFLHDIQNTSAIMMGLNEMFDEMEHDEVKKIIQDVSGRLSDEIRSYKLITTAESHTLQVQPREVNTWELMEEAIESLQNLGKFHYKKVITKGEGLSIKTDKTLLRQVLINMIKNAFEAGPPRDQIEIHQDFDPRSGEVIISVSNSQHIAEDTQLLLFQKTFSTKGHGRGWGTYSIKLLTEKYLKGSVSFISTKEKGTTFTIRVPDLD